MEPLDTDMDYMVRSRQLRPTTPMSPADQRFYVLLIFPVIGILLILVFIGAAIFQWNLAAVLVDTLMGVMMVFFVLLVAGLFWAFAPKSKKA